MGSVAQEIRKRVIKVKTKKQLIVAIECCVGNYNTETTIHFGEDTTYIFKFKERSFNNSVVDSDTQIKNQHRLYDKRLKDVISKLKKVKKTEIE